MVLGYLEGGERGRGESRDGREVVGSMDTDGDGCDKCCLLVTLPKQIQCSQWWRSKDAFSMAERTMVCADGNEIESCV